MRSSRVTVYVLIRVAAALVFILAATVLPRGIPAALVIMLAGLAAVFTCFGVNAGGPGETAGARPQDRWFDAHAAPQGDWPPYDPGAPERSASERSGPPEASSGRSGTS